MPTAEDYKITKHGGLADVPPQLAEAIAGNDLAMPVIISPMYKDEGTFVRRFADGTQIKYSAASFKQITAEDNTRYGSDLEKLMEFKMDVFTGNKNEKRKINMEVFQAIEKIKAEDGSEKEVKRILLSTDNSFDACYTYNEPVEEKERFGAIFSKGVYEFRKLVEDFNTKSVKDVSTPFKNDKKNRTLFAKKLDALKPDATILNDWHVAPLTALYKIKAPLEAARKDLSPKAAAAMMDQNISIIVHNGAYIGDSSGENSAKILNTLFGDDTTGIVENATIKWADGVTGESDNVFVLQDKSDKTKNKYSSLLQVGLAYADVAIPVSRNYAKEIASAVTPTIKGTGRAEETTTNIKTILAERFKHNTMIGVVNGFDSNVARLTPKKIGKLETFEIGGKDYAIKGYKPYDYSKEASIEQNLKIKDENKQVFIDWLHGKLKDGNIRLHGEPKYSDISDINKDNIKDIPIIFMGSRVASQKGFGVAKDAIVNIMNGYSQKYPGKQKPLVIIGGPTQDDSVKFLKQLKEELKEDGKRVLAVDGTLPNDVIFPAADIKMGPSIFEPCGLVQQQAEAALNIPAFSKVGGHVDTIQDGVTGIVEPLEDYAEKALPRALKVLFDADKRKAMLYKGMQEDFNWAQKTDDGKLKGPAIEHLQLLGMDSEKWVPLNKVNSPLT
jgi:glycogen synthase